MLLSPNPTTNTLYISYLNQNEMSGQLEIFNALGVQVISRHLKIESGASAVLSVEQLPSGTYLLIFRNEKGKIEQGRFVKE